MIFSKIVPYEEIIKKLDKKEDKIAIISCNTCARTCGNGGISKLNELGLRLIRDGYYVTDEAVILYVCSEPMLREAKLDLEANTIIVLSCSAGWASLTRNFPDKKVLQVTEDIGLVMTDTDKEIFKVIMPYKNHESEMGKEYRINTGEPLVGEKIKVRCV
ncbi:hypothetical protein GH146_01170 [archaeon]|nr:hypothetical protein [archaeon]TET27121.1 MAG: hypothetical protein E3J73_03145 [Candidatus Bathyarchaeum sp.]